jgi:hypothetical protein
MSGFFFVSIRRFDGGSLVQISMATEIAALKLEIHNLWNERGSSQTTAEDGTLETSAVVLSSSTYLSGGLVPPATFAQREIYILG